MLQSIINHYYYGTLYSNISSSVSFQLLKQQSRKLRNFIAKSVSESNISMGKLDLESIMSSLRLDFEKEGISVRIDRDS